MLCYDCEKLFSSCEKWFADNIFYPCKKQNKDEFEYNSKLHYFITSLSWRSLYLDIVYHVMYQDIDILYLNKMIESENILKQYLLGQSNDIGKMENHIFYIDRIKEVGGENKDKFLLNPHITVHRSITSYTVATPDTIYTISNLMGIILVTLFCKGKNEKWKGTKINCGNGKVFLCKQEIRSVVCNEINYWMDEMEKQKDILSCKQQKKIIQRIKNVGEDVKKYDIYRDFCDDMNLKNS